MKLFKFIVALSILLSNICSSVSAQEPNRPQMYDNPDTGSGCPIVVGTIQHLTGSHSYTGSGVQLVRFKNSTNIFYEIKVQVTNGLIDILDLGGNSIMGTIVEGYVTGTYTILADVHTKDAYFYFHGLNNNSSYNIIYVKASYR